MRGKTRGALRGAIFSLIVASAFLSTAHHAHAQSQSVAVPPDEATNTVDYLRQTKVEKSKLSLVAGLNGQYLDDTQSRRSRGGLSIEVEGQRKFSDQLQGIFNVGNYFYDGSTASFYNNLGSAQNQYISVNRASLIYKPVGFFDLEVGFLGRNFTTLPSTFRTTGLLGANERIYIGNTDGNWTGIEATQVALSADVDQNIPKNSGTPTLLMVGLVSALKTDHLKFEVSAYKYKFENLNNALASSQTAIDTNTTRGGPPAAVFAYQYNGYQGGAKLDLEVSKRLSFGMRGGYIWNEYAVAGKSQGASLALGSNVSVSPQLVLKPEVGLFYNERDVIPANFTTYSLAGLGGLNRRAYTAYLEAELPQQDVSIYGRVVLAQEIEDRPYTSDRAIFTIGMEAKYDVL